MLEIFNKLQNKIHVLGLVVVLYYERPKKCFFERGANEIIQLFSILSAGLGMCFLYLNDAIAANCHMHSKMLMFLYSQSLFVNSPGRRVEGQAHKTSSPPM